MTATIILNGQRIEIDAKLLQRCVDRAESLTVSLRVVLAAGHFSEEYLVRDQLEEYSRDLDKLRKLEEFIAKYGKEITE